MTETPDTVTEQWEDQWSMVPRYERWIESLGIPIHRSYFIDDLRTIEVGPWEERECNAAIVVLSGQADFMETRVTEIPPAATLPPFKFSLDDVIYVLSGHGLTTVWAEDGGIKRTFEWQPHSMFFIPKNYTYQLANAQGHEPARLFHYNYLPMTMSINIEPEYFFNNPALKPTVDILSEGSDIYSEAKLIAGSKHGTDWTAAFFPDLLLYDKIVSRDREGTVAPGHLRVCLPNVTSLRLGSHVLPAGTYKGAHYHGAGAVVLIPGGEGFSLMWPMGGDPNDKMFVPWHEGSIFGPPNMWYHHHFNLGPSEMRYLTLHPARHIEPDYHGSGIAFVDEDIATRQLFEAELAKRGLESQMPPEIYTDPHFRQKRKADD